MKKANGRSRNDIILKDNFKTNLSIYEIETSGERNSKASGPMFIVMRERRILLH